ncbi:hypothetical protein SLEP1_g59477 [Rubroshorea leprosula]|uniref:Uncharacterized protein n=1 Tax=Rubroshorea leprosula TaxID=152421 RepID=A0AAV5MSG7_9ROSI|nr:hypothetical protein SLEP1_g59477 [Rubroshorea leprosula]
MAMEKKPHRRLCRRQKHLLQVPIGVSFRQQHLQRTMLYAFRRVKGEATKKEMKSQGKERVELTELEARFIQLEARFTELEARFTELEARFTQLRAESGHALEESSWTQLEARIGEKKGLEVHPCVGLCGIYVHSSPTSKSPIAHPNRTPEAEPPANYRKPHEVKFPALHHLLLHYALVHHLHQNYPFRC